MPTVGGGSPQMPPSGILKFSPSPVPSRDVLQTANSLGDSRSREQRTNTVNTFHNVYISFAPPALVFPEKE